ncbi:hypothetical protein D9758_005921 [Tetrapyrgos nigripes]|uniref:DUF6535 domain-containing protein n=1 Tax=Tetrapyrgos nigripes TaxID=182062 RepID=A0A8H5LH90_9AGAR|nr:hypothetical protein D9758_005921 [Tetrapyrgos nigripes]
MICKMTSSIEKNVFVVSHRDPASDCHCGFGRYNRGSWCSAVKLGFVHVVRAICRPWCEDLEKYFVFYSRGARQEISSRQSLGRVMHLRNCQTLLCSHYRMRKVARNCGISTIGEARRYDEDLLKGWKEDMDGMLLFSALYSVSLTAFIIESYKTLQDDPAQTTVALLSQISQQLSSALNGTSTPLQPSPDFEPPVSAVVCNTLWFLSLALALTCSLLATFVQQWTRDFIHKTNLRPSPVRQAKALAFLYLGLRNFGMHSFVDVIPILLHISLLLFFGGLVPFLLPVNKPLTYLMACVLGIFVAVYCALACIPLLYLDAPYRTPLSAALWRFRNVTRALSTPSQDSHPPDQTLTEAMLEKSLEDSLERDNKAMVFTSSTTRNYYPLSSQSQMLLPIPVQTTHM